MALEHLGLDLLEEREALASLLVKKLSGKREGSVASGAEVKHLIKEAVRQTRGLGHNYVGTEHLTLALLVVDSGQAGAFLRSRGISYESLRGAVIALFSS